MKQAVIPLAIAAALLVAVGLDVFRNQPDRPCIRIADAMPIAGNCR